MAHVVHGKPCERRCRRPSALTGCPPTERYRAVFAAEPEWSPDLTPTQASEALRREWRRRNRNQKETNN